MNLYASEQAKMYDKVYENKDYAQEASFVVSLINEFTDKKPSSLNLLDVGCGTGEHSMLLATEFHEVLGIDQSSDMIHIALQKQKSRSNLAFCVSDFLSFQGSHYDVITMFFNVMGYLSAQNHIDKVFEQLSKILKNQGLAIFDFWDSNNLSAQYEILRTKKFLYGDKVLVKESSGVVDYKNSSIAVNLDWFEEQNVNHRKLVSSESHKIQTLDPQTLSQLLETKGFKVLLSSNDQNAPVPFIDGRSHWLVIRKLG